jgi:HK97 gp10 family phage protein
MTSVRVDVSDVYALAVAMEAQTRTTAASAAQAVARSAAAIERDAKIFAPVDTGALRSSISRTVTGLTAEIGPTALYGGFVEHGTSRSGPNPYMRTALARATPGFVAAMTRLGTARG